MNAWNSKIALALTAALVVFAFAGEVLAGGRHRTTTAVVTFNGTRVVVAIPGPQRVWTGQVGPFGERHGHTPYGVGRQSFYRILPQRGNIVRRRPLRRAVHGRPRLFESFRPRRNHRRRHSGFSINIRLW